MRRTWRAPFVKHKRALSAGGIRDEPDIQSKVFLKVFYV